MRYTEEELIDTLDRKIERMQTQLEYLEDFMELMYLTDDEAILKKRAVDIIKKKIRKVTKAKTLKKVNKTIDLEKLMEDEINKLQGGGL